MPIQNKKCCLALGLALTSASPLVSADVEFELSGSVAAQLRTFTQTAKFAGQSQQVNLSLSLEPDLYWQWNDGVDAINLKPFYRLDQHDDERSHGDIRELSWVHYSDHWELRTGWRKVFWGVTEFQHLVDVINQNDGVEDIDNEDKLGQPMVNLSLVNPWGIVDLFVLPGFRERTFAGLNGRLRAGLPVDPDQASYEASQGDNHTDFAVRWNHSIGDYDLGAYWFKGTNRTPQYRLDLTQGQPVLKPYYGQMTQLGMDVQATLDSWLYKGELIWRDSSADAFFAAQLGLEYTFYGISESIYDLGVLVEYGWDQRGSEADGLFQNDLSVGARLTLNDVASTELLGGFIHDLDYNSTSIQLEVSRRLGESWKLSLDGRFFSASDRGDPMIALDQDDYFQLTLERYF